jgi:hypothetical protein
MKKYVVLAALVAIVVVGIGVANAAGVLPFEIIWTHEGDAAGPDSVYWVEEGGCRLLCVADNDGVDCEPCSGVVLATAATQQSTKQVEPTATQKPGATNTPVPPATNTPVPPATNTPVPPATNTPVPPATNTPVPPATNTPVPSGAGWYHHWDSGNPPKCHEKYWHHAPPPHNPEWKSGRCP